MTEHSATERLPAAMERLLKRMERLTARMPMATAVALILLVGTLLTTAVTGAVWWTEQNRQNQAFAATASRARTLLQERLDHHMAMVRQMADWAAYQSIDSNESAAWASQGVALVGPGTLRSGMLPALLDLHDEQASQLKRCLVNWVLSNEAMLCSVGARPHRGAGWFLIERVKQAGMSWVIQPLSDVELQAVLDDGVYWQVSTGIEHASAQGGPAHSQSEGARQGPADRAISGHVIVAGSKLPITIQGWRRDMGWSSTISRQLPMLLAAGAGLLFTLGGLHVYMMLISTRRRAKDMARDMSAALQRTQSRNQAVMDTAPDAIVMADAHGQVRWCNQATTSIFGRTIEQIGGKHIGDILPVLATGEIDDWFGTHGFSNRVIGFETTGVRNEGTAFPVALSASRVELDGELIQTFIVRDTTDAKWAEQELSLRDRALASSADGVIIVSMTLPNQPIIYVNHAFELITGYEAHEVLGTNCKLLQRDDLDQLAIADMRAAIKAGQPCNVVVRNYRKDGTLFYNDLAISPVLSPEGLVTHYVGVQTDITDRIAAEQVLKLRTERLNAVFDLSPDGFVVFDKRGEVSIVNPSFERMTGLRAVDLVGQARSAFDDTLYARCTRSEVDEAIALQGADGEGGLSARELLSLHTPAPRTLLRRVRHGDRDNETVMYFRDITHEQEVDRMKSEFLAMAAHELRTPMVSIFGFTELLLKRNFNDERRAEMLGTIHKQASILINLVNELLDLARIEARRGKDFNRRLQPLGPIIEQVLEGLKVPGDRRKVRVHLEARPLMVWADTEKLGQAVLNVLSNAYKYSPQGGEIHLSVSSDEKARRVVIEVQDHGIGMSSEQLGRVFERFFRADPSGNIPGTGLGMSLVKEIMSLHQGDVQVTSELGAGTTVRLFVPAQVDADMAETVPPKTRGDEVHTEVSPG
jgi:PAS domain S-box-containing protein